tara:strand:+ start:419 stop:955 length:537 start_codon:yes stop_codon:yes gene_type:complete
MDSFEINKIIISILLVVLLVLGVDKVGDIVFKVEKPKVAAYKVEGLVATTASTSSSSSAEPVDISALLALGSVEKGKKVFKKCAACHSINAGGGNKIGPKLWNAMFRPVGAVTDYKYSKALSSYGKEWTWEEMNGFLIKPAKWIKGNKMGFAGLKKEEERASVILYLNENSDNPKPLP